MTYVGIDQSYGGFGLTFLKTDGSSKTLVGKFDPKKKGPGVTRLKAVEYWLQHHLVAEDLDESIEHICMEGYANGAKFGREQAGELGALVKLVLHDQVFEDELTRFPTIVSPMSLKKFVLGVGKGGKNEMLLGTYKKWGADFRDDNASDSFGLAKIALAIHTGKTSFKYEDEVLAKLTTHTEFHSQ